MDINKFNYNSFVNAQLWATFAHRKDSNAHYPKMIKI